jgi:putative radical SAM enzyme (TIGR03279 family)
MDRASYAPTSPLPEGHTGGVVTSIDDDSPASRAGLAAGDTVLAADGVVLRDILDWQWNSDGREVALSVRGADGADRELTLTREDGESWGVDFASALFDGVRTCRNNCAFCFMTQLPKGLRRALYVRDDDYRLSFLQGNFITLTNLGDDEIERIAEQNLSPLYVSLHAVDPQVRAKLVCAREDRALERFDQLVEAGIDLHVQIVLVPGVNDGDELDKTLTWLAEREGVASVGVVPLGYTRHQEIFSASYNDPFAAATVIQQVQRWQFAMKERDGVSWVHLADEFYLNARAPIPSTPWYDEFPQYENGIGIVRTFVDEALELRPQLAEAVLALPEDSEAVTFVTGVMSATTIAGALNACDAAGRVRLLVVPNSFFGGNVSVTGLLTGVDIAGAIAGDTSRLVGPTVYLLPDIVFNADGITLDDMTFPEIAEKSGADVRLVSSDAAGMLAGLLEAARPSTD